MTLQNSGTIHLSNVNAEIGAATNATITMNDAPVRRVAKKEGSGVQYAMSDFYGKRYEAIVNISSHTAHANLSTFFSSADWSNPYITKVVNILPGIHVWSYTQGVPALRTGTGRSGPLEIRNQGYILGHAGQPNSGVGGTAILVEQNLTYIWNSNVIYGGGGAGGVGGQGGTGWYTAQEGPFFQEAYYEFSKTVWGWYEPNWAGVRLDNPNGYSNSPFVNGIYTYYQGAFAYNYYRYNGWAGQSGNHEGYYIYRTYTAYVAGAAGGSGGWGTGYNSGLSNVQTNGAGGGNNGGNSGIGGTGGLGGGWGAQGATGATGNSGNASSGSAGSAGGLGGYYISGSSNLALFSNSGSVLGRYL